MLQFHLRVEHCSSVSAPRNQRAAVAAPKLDLREYKAHAH